MVKICQTQLLKLNFEIIPKNTFSRPCMKLKNFFCQFPNPWTLRVSGMGGYASKCEKKSKSLHPNAHVSMQVCTRRPQGVVSIRMHMLAHEAGDCEGIQKSPLVGETDGHFSATRYYSYAPYTYTYSYRQKCRRRTFLTVSSQCLGRFRSFFRFYKSQYYVRNIIFYNFFCFDIPKIIYEQFSVRG